MEKSIEEIFRSQKELIDECKGTKTWDELAWKVNCCLSALNDLQKFVRESIRKADNTIIGIDNGLLPIEEKKLDDVQEQIREQDLHNENLQKDKI